MAHSSPWLTLGFPLGVMWPLVWQMDRHTPHYLKSSVFSLFIFPFSRAPNHHWAFYCFSSFFFFSFSKMSYDWDHRVYIAPSDWLPLLGNTYWHFTHVSSWLDSLSLQHWVISHCWNASFCLTIICCKTRWWLLHFGKKHHLYIVFFVWQ